MRGLGRAVKDLLKATQQDMADPGLELAFQPLCL